MPKMKVIKSIYIDSAPEKIYPIISDLNNWQEWSPWVIAEPRAQLNVASDGKFHEWDGDIIGTGNLKIQDEVENKKVVEKIASSETLKAYNYGIAHYESPDFRGIDTALLYRKTLFRPTHQKVYALELVDHKTGAKRTTRDILVVSGY